MRYHYIDIVTGKTRYTRGKFTNWTRGGPFNVGYACFQTKGGNWLLIPEWSLTAETRAAIPPKPETLQPKPCLDRR